MARFPTCPDCSADIVDKDKAKKISGRWVCEDCQEVREREQQDRMELYEYVAKLFNIKFPTGVMRKQIKEYKENLEYTYKGMTLSLEYWNETLDNSMAEARGVGIIPFIYEDAKEFYIQRLKLADLETVETTEKVVNIRRPKKKIDKPKYRDIIDMDNL